MTPVRQYIRDVRKLMSTHGRNEKRFLADLRRDLESYCEDHPDNSDFDSLVREFGSPKETYIHYLLAQDDSYLIHATQVRGMIAAIVLAILVFIGAIFGISAYYSHKMDVAFRDAMNRMSEMERAADTESAAAAAKADTATN